MATRTATTPEVQEAHHAGMEDAYGNLTALLDRLHHADLHLTIWTEGTQVLLTVDGDGVLTMGDAAAKASARIAAGRVDELLGALEEWCNDWLPTGHEVAT